MKYCILIALISVTSCKKSNTYKGEKALTDKEIAISIAERKWKQVYGKSAINKQKPFVAEKKMTAFGLYREIFHHHRQ